LGLVEGWWRMVAGQNGGTREGGGRWWQKLRPTVLEREAGGLRCVAGEKKRENG
jgi:hypothetical protein